MNAAEREPTAPAHPRRQARPQRPQRAGGAPPAPSLVDVPMSQAARRYVAVRTRRAEITGTTPKTYRVFLTAFAREIGDPPVSAVRRRHLDVWWKKRNPGVRSRRQHVSRLRSFFAWAIDEGYTDTDPTAGVLPPRAPRRPPRALPADDVARLLGVCRDHRDRLIVLLGAQEGLRAQEMAGLDIDDIDFPNRLLLVREGKGGNERVLPLSEQTEAALRCYLAETGARSGRVLRSAADPTRGVTAGTVSNFGTMLCWAAGIKRARWDGVSLHALRHTAATDMLRNGAHLLDVRTALGHRHVSTTEAYLPWVVGDLREAMGGRRYGA